MEKEFKAVIHLLDSQYCNGCDFLVKTDKKDGSLGCFCNHFREWLVYDIRRRVSRIKKCFDTYGE